MDYDDYGFLQVEVRDGIAWCRLGNPARMGAVDLDGHAEFSRVLRDVAADDDVRVLLTHGGDGAYSVGGDLDLLEGLVDGPDEDAERLMTDARDLVLAHVELDKPVVTALTGPALGSGAAFALLSDYIVMERGVVLADGHVRAALAAGDGGAMIWPLTVGLTTAKRYLLTGDGIDADEALRAGLVSEVVSPGEAVDRAAEVARRLADGPQRAIRYTKQALNQWLRAAVPIFDHSLGLEVRTMGTAEVRDAIRGLREERRPAIPPDPRG